MDEKSLLKRLQNRDEKVFEEIIDRYNAYVTTIVRSLLSSRGTKEDMEEVVADAFIALWETAERINYERYSSIKAYIAVIARNKAKDRLRMIHGQDLLLLISQFVTNQICSHVTDLPSFVSLAFLYNPADFLPDYLFHLQCYV